MRSVLAQTAEGLHVHGPGVRPTSPDAARLREALAAAASAEAAVRAGQTEVLAAAAARERAEERAFALGLASQAKVGIQFLTLAPSVEWCLHAASRRPSTWPSCSQVCKGHMFNITVRHCKEPDSIDSNVHGAKLHDEFLHAMAACDLQRLSARLGVHADISGRLWQYDSCDGMQVCRPECMQVSLRLHRSLARVLQVDQRSSARNHGADALRLTHQANSHSA